MLRKLLSTFEAMRCPHPMPGPSFPWGRCQYGCSWCDYIQSWASMPRKSLFRPPYR